jgi:hypothetical protein
VAIAIITFVYLMTWPNYGFGWVAFLSLLIRFSYDYVLSLLRNFSNIQRDIIEIEDTLGSLGPIGWVLVQHYIINLVWHYKTFLNKFLTL